MTSSIHRRVLIWVMGALFVGAALLVGGFYWTLAEGMEKVYDDNVKQLALAVANQHGTYSADRPSGLAEPPPRVSQEYGTFEFVTVVWTLDGQRVYSSDPQVALPFLSRSGLTRVTIGGEQWHLYTIVLEDGIVQAAQRASERQSLSRAMASATILPALVLLGLIALLLTLALRGGLVSLARAAGAVADRSAASLDPLKLADHPRELHPLIGAINDLMARLGQALALQRHFLSDAAHELRTPITALRLQLQLLERASSESQRERAMDELRAGVARAQHLIEQLLQLSRLAPETPALRREAVDLAALARSAVSHFSARAESLHIDLGAIEADPASVAGDAQQLTILLNNLVDNALSHTPQGGRIDVTAQQQAGQACLVVSDNGPGVPAAERERVFDRFYRGSPAPGAALSYGSGLGLAIVKAVAERHGATVTLDDAPAGGLRVRVCFPAL